MRRQLDVEIEVAIPAAVESLAALAAQAQPLAVCRTLGNARLEGTRRARKPSGGVVLGHAQVEFHQRAYCGVFQWNAYCDLEVLPRHGDARPAAARPPAATAEPS